MESSSTYLYGKRYRNRLFVGGLPLNTTAEELAGYFSHFGHVIEAKIIFDEQQVPKGYGFVTFQSEGDVRNVTEMGTLFLRNKKLNLGPAVKKQVPQVVDNPELVVVASNQMKGEYYYPVPYAATQHVTHPPAVQIPTYYAPAQMPTFFNPDHQVPFMPYIGHYHEEHPSPPMCQVQPVLHRHVHPKKRRVPPRFRRPREN
ncbi:hypothetical protein ACROYT_G004467 [Oculina patagonica]